MVKMEELIDQLVYLYIEFRGISPNRLHLHHALYTSLRYECAPHWKDTVVIGSICVEYCGLKVMVRDDVQIGTIYVDRAEDGDIGQRRHFKLEF